MQHANGRDERSIGRTRPAAFLTASQSGGRQNVAFIWHGAGGAQTESEGRECKANQSFVCYSQTSIATSVLPFPACYHSYVQVYVHIATGRLCLSGLVPSEAPRQPIPPSAGSSPPPS